MAYYPYQINPFVQQQQPQQAFVSVRSEQEAMSYPVAPGNSIVFKDESQPFCYVKSMSYNQFDRPTFDRYRLVKEEVSEPVEYALKADLDAIWDELKALKGGTKKQVEDVEPSTKKQKRWVEVDDE